MQILYIKGRVCLKSDIGGIFLLAGKSQGSAKVLQGWQVIQILRLNVALTFLFKNAKGPPFPIFNYFLSRYTRRVKTKVVVLMINEIILGLVRKKEASAVAL